MDSLDRFENEIIYWNAKLDANSSDKDFELSFFKIYIKYEKLISDIFIHFCLGRKNLQQKRHKRKLGFKNEEQLRGLLRSKSNHYIDFFEKLESVSEYIFVVNPFGVIFNDAVISEHLIKMKILRNYIAHESPESKTKYIRSVLNNSPFIEPGKYLTTKPRNQSQTYYSKFITSLENSINLLWYT